MSELESHWVPLSYGLVPHLSKKLCKLPHTHYIYIYIYIYIYTHTEDGNISFFMCQATLKSCDTMKLSVDDYIYVSRTKWSNPGKGVAPSPTLQCSSY